MLSSDVLNRAFSSPVRKLQALAELWDGSPNAAYTDENGEIVVPVANLVKTFAYTDNLQSFSVERVGEGKFFGFGVCQRLNIKLRDVNRELDITTSNTFIIKVGVDDEYKQIFPTFFVTEVNRDENTNVLSVTAYDYLYQANQHYFNELELARVDEDTGEIYPIPYNLTTIFFHLARVLPLRLGGIFENVSDGSESLYYPQGANFEGTETLREMLDAIAEATQTVYFVDTNETLTFHRLDRDGAPVLKITKSDYFTLKSKTNRRLATIAHVTELGDNVSASLEVSGSTQYIRDNPFWELRDDLTTLVDTALAGIGGLTINQFECEWRGNGLLEIGDKIAITTKDDDIVTSFVLDDTITYDGRFKQKTKWSYDDNEDEAPAHPTNLGDAVKKTYAKVDKVNKEIELVASQVGKFDERIAELELTTDSIQGSVTKVEKEYTTVVGALEEQVETLTNKVEATITAEDVKILIQEEFSDGISSVTTETGFTFNEDGLTVSKEGTEMTTLISEDGMIVYKDNDEVLVANNQGVQATNLHATTYLIVGKYSRFEDYEEDGDYRTGCFWIGEVY